MPSSWAIYHNPKCSKSRGALEILHQNGIHAQVIEYLDAGIEAKTFEKIIAKSKKNPELFLRKKEAEFSEYQEEDLSCARSVAKILEKCPKILERPVVVRGDDVVLARPPELVQELFQ